MPCVTTAFAALPDLDALDSDALKALVIEKHTEVISHKTEIENLKLLIFKLKRMQFGRSSERFDREVEQLELRLEDLETNQASDKTAPSVVERAVSVKPARRPLPAELPRETETLRPKEDASFSDRVAYAVWLDSVDLSDAAREVWRRLSRERPDEERLRQLAGP